MITYQNDDYLRKAVSLCDDDLEFSIATGQRRVSGSILSPFANDGKPTYRSSPQDSDGYAFKNTLRNLTNKFSKNGVPTSRIVGPNNLLVLAYGDFSTFILYKNHHEHVLMDGVVYPFIFNVNHMTYNTASIKSLSEKMKDNNIQCGFFGKSLFGFNNEGDSVILRLCIGI